MQSKQELVPGPAASRSGPCASTTLLLFWAVAPRSVTCPGERILGLSKPARVVGHFAARPQNPGAADHAGRHVPGGEPAPPRAPAWCWRPGHTCMTQRGHRHPRCHQPSPRPCWAPLRTDARSRRRVSSPWPGRARLTGNRYNGPPVPRLGTGRRTLATGRTGRSPALLDAKQRRRHTDQRGHAGQERGADGRRGGRPTWHRRWWSMAPPGGRTGGHRLRFHRRGTAEAGGRRGARWSTGPVTSRRRLVPTAVRARRCGNRSWSRRGDVLVFVDAEPDPVGARTS